MASPSPSTAQGRQPMDRAARAGLNGTDQRLDNSGKNGLAGPDDPGWDLNAYNARKQDALGSLQTDATAADARAKAAHAAGQYDAEADAKREAVVARSNYDSATPDFRSDDGQFHQGDLVSTMRNEQVAAKRELNDQMGRPNGPIEDDNASWDTHWASLSPEDKYRRSVVASVQERNQRNAARMGEQIRHAVPGKVGQAMGDAVEMNGGLDPTSLAGAAHARFSTPGCNTHEGTAPAPTAQPTPPGQIRASLVKPGTPLPAASAATTTGTQTNGTKILREEDAHPSVRDDSGVVMRGDTRTPDQVRQAGGFYGHDPATNVPLADHMPQSRPQSAWVSAAADEGVAQGFAANPFPQGKTGVSQADLYRAMSTNSGYVYNVYQPGGVKTEALTPALQAGNSEVSFSNGIPFNNVHSWYQMNGFEPGARVNNPAYTGPRVPAYGD